MKAYERAIFVFLILVALGVGINDCASKKDRPSVALSSPYHCFLRKKYMDQSMVYLFEGIFSGSLVSLLMVRAGELGEKIFPDWSIILFKELMLPWNAYLASKMAFLFGALYYPLLIDGNDHGIYHFDSYTSSSVPVIINASSSATTSPSISSTSPKSISDTFHKQYTMSFHFLTCPYFYVWPLIQMLKGFLQEVVLKSKSYFAFYNLFAPVGIYTLHYEKEKVWKKFPHLGLAYNMLESLVFSLYTYTLYRIHVGHFWICILCVLFLQYGMIQSINGIWWSINLVLMLILLSQFTATAFYIHLKSQFTSLLEFDFPNLIFGVGFAFLFSTMLRIDQALSEKFDKASLSTSAVTSASSPGYIPSAFTVMAWDSHVNQEYTERIQLIKSSYLDKKNKTPLSSFSSRK